MNNYSKLSKIFYYALLAIAVICLVLDLFTPSGRANLFYLGCAIVLIAVFPYLGPLLKIKLSSITMLTCCIYMFIAIYLSNRYNLYKRFWYYDVILHTLSGLILAFFFSDIFYPLDSDKAYVKETPMAMKIMAPLISAIAGAGVWEITEFLFDILTKNDVQRNLTLEHEIISSSWQNPGILDTMNDMINGTVGALFGTLILALERIKKKKEAR